MRSKQTEEPWHTNESELTIDGATCRVTREGLRWRYQVSYVAGPTLRHADGRADTEDAARVAAVSEARRMVG